MDLLKTIFGSSGAPSQSNNQAYDYLKGAFAAPVAGAGAGYGAAANLLGLGGAPAQGDALKNWYNSSGGQFLLNQGTNDVDARASAMGGGQSGGTLRALENMRQGLASTKLNEYLGNIMNLNQQSLGAGNLIANAGQQSTGEEKASNGLLGSALAIFSDPKLKTDVKRTGSLGVYTYRYKSDPPGTKRRGTMADEVDREFPEASGPRVAGYRTVDMAKIMGAI